MLLIMAVERSCCLTMNTLFDDQTIVRKIKIGLCCVYLV